MDEQLKVKDAANRFGVKEITVRRWCDVFKDFLSFDANPSNKQTRLFTDDDMKVLAVVAHIKKTKGTFRQARHLLEQGQRMIPPPPKLEVTFEQAEVVQTEIIGYQQRIKQLEDERDKLIGRAALADAYKQMLDAANDEINKLHRKLGELGWQGDK